MQFESHPDANPFSRCGVECVVDLGKPLAGVVLALAGVLLALAVVLPAPVAAQEGMDPEAAAEVEIPSDEIQMAQALLAAPTALRDGATVLAWREGGHTAVVREGSNSLICLADRPGDERFDVACYHESLEPYMERGRELSRQGVENRAQVRWDEYEAGELSMPEVPAALYITFGDFGVWDAETLTAPNARTRYVLYTPNATAESMGLPTRPSGPGEPWLMFPNTPGAHIMITPPPTESGPGSGKAGGG